MQAKTLMIQGTGSSVGKSIMVTAFCRIFRQQGLRVAPYKSQNMALNSFVTREGGEMGRSQVVQAEAAGVEPHVDMNPILIKPEADTRSQIVVMGKPWKTLEAGKYYTYSPELLSVAMEALNRLRATYDLVVIEGAGSPAEPNLKQKDIVNMKIAKLAGAPVFLVGDIDKGGVFASFVGTLALLDREEQGLIKGFIINKFRGDISLLQPGLDYLENLTSKPVIGVVPYYHRILIPEEDSIYKEEGEKCDRNIDIAVIYLPHISNSTDFEPLQQEAGVQLRYITARDELGNPDIIILPGSKSTVSDLEQIRKVGLADSIVRKAKTGTPVIGICGGFQMLGKRIEDPFNTESREGSAEGLGLLDIVTVFDSQKTTWQVKAQAASNSGLLEGLEGMQVAGYEIHMAQSRGNNVTPAFKILQRGEKTCNVLEGAINESGRVLGTYIHGLFDDNSFRQAFVNLLRQRKGLAPQYAKPITSSEDHYDKLAEVVRTSLNMPLVHQICGLR